MALGRWVLAFGCIAVVTWACGADPPRTATPPAARSARAHVWVGTTDPGPGCQFLGEVSAEEGESRDRYSELVRAAAQLGGNYLMLERSRPSGFGWGYRIIYEAQGRAYRCNAEPVPASSAAGAAPAAACEPECSPGYVCVRGACVSACNPPCAQNELCGADRICRPKP